MRITEAEMQSRRRIAALQSAITETIADGAAKAQYTWTEVLAALAHQQQRAIAELLREEREEPPL